MRGRGGWRRGKGRGCFRLRLRIGWEGGRDGICLVVGKGFVVGVNYWADLLRSIGREREGKDGHIGWLVK
jgi:hypothetical protein